MSYNYNLQLVICGSTDTSGSTALCLPSIEQITLPDFHTLKTHVVNHSKSHSFIVLLLNSNDQSSSSALEDLNKAGHIFAIFIRVQHGCNLTFNGGNVYPVAKQFIMHKITASAIRFFDIAAERSLALNHIIPATTFKRQANALKHQRRSANTTIKACHVLIIPLNVKEDHLFEFQGELIDLCNDLCPDMAPTVHTLDDYFARDENPDLYGNEDLDVKRNFIKRISWIRMYLIGNEIRTLHPLSQSLLENELNGTLEDRYDAIHTFVEYEPVTDRTKQTLANVLGYTWQSTNIPLRRLDEIRNDIEFSAALERVDVNLQAREMVADIELNQQATDQSNNSIEFSGVFCIAREAQSGPSEHNDGTDPQIDNNIQYNSAESFPE